MTSKESHGKELCPKPPAAFLREATGLVRDFTVIDAMILAVASVVGPATWVVGYAGEWFAFPGVSIPISFVFAGILGLGVGFYYVLISTAMPRSGGGTYVPLSRIIHPVLGIGMSFILVAFLILSTAVNASLVALVAIAGPVATLGVVTGNSGLQSLASTLFTPTWSFIIGLITILFASLVAVAGNRVIALINKIAVIIGTAGFIIIVVELASITQPQFQAAFEGFAGSGAYQKMISLANTAGYSIPSNWFIPTLLSLPLTYFLLLGYEFNTYYAGEIRRVSRTMSIAIPFAVIYGAAFFGIIAFLMQRAFGLDFIASASYLFTAGSSSYPLSFAPWVNNFLVVVDSNWLVNSVLIASFVAWGYLLLITWIMVISRNFLAWSFDRAVPSVLGKVDDRFHCPLVAIALTSLLSIIALAFYIFLPAVASVVNISFLLLTAVFLDGLAGAFLPWAKKSLFDSSQEIVKRKIGRIPLISVLGIFSVVFTGLLLADSLYNPEIAGPLGASTMVTIFGSFALGAVIYLAMKAYNARRGLDLSFVYKEIPPE